MVAELRQGLQLLGNYFPGCVCARASRVCVHVQILNDIVFVMVTMTIYYKKNTGLYNTVNDIVSKYLLLTILLTLAQLIFFFPPELTPTVLE